MFRTPLRPLFSFFCFELRSRRDIKLSLRFLQSKRIFSSRWNTHNYFILSGRSKRILQIFSPISIYYYIQCEQIQVECIDRSSRAHYGCCSRCENGRQVSRLRRTYLKSRREVKERKCVYERHRYESRKICIRSDGRRVIYELWQNRKNTNINKIEKFVHILRLFAYFFSHVFVHLRLAFHPFPRKFGSLIWVLDWLTACVVAWRLDALDPEGTCCRTDCVCKCHIRVNRPATNWCSKKIWK